MPDYENDAGLTLQEYDYPDDPPPAEEIVATLCNLNREYIGSLRAESPDGEPLVDDNLRLSVLTMSDNLSLWDGLRFHYPQVEDAIDTAWHIRDLWHAALLHSEDGEDEAASRAMGEAEREIANLPSEGSFGDIDCAT